MALCRALIRSIPSLFVPSDERRRNTAHLWSRSNRKYSLGLTIFSVPPCLSGGCSSVEVAATQEEAAGLAYHFAAGVAHLCAAIRAIAGNIGLPCRLGCRMNLCSWIGLAFIVHRVSSRSVTPIPGACILKRPCNSSGIENISPSRVSHPAQGP